MKQNQIPSEKQLGSQTVESEQEPEGSIPVVEAQQAHIDFLEDNPHVSHVILRITDVQTLLNRDETADSYFDDDIEVITTTTIHDRILSQLDWQEELELILQFGPDFHIPCDYPVYKAWSREKRLQHIQDCLKGTIWITDRLANTGTKVIPLLKGETREERGYCYKVFKELLDTDCCVFYGAQYFTASVGFYKLFEDIQQVVSEASHLRIILIGLQSPDWLEKLPPQVMAVAGQRWIRESKLRSTSIENAQENYEELNKNIERALESGQVPISAWTPSTEVTV